MSKHKLYWCFSIGILVSLISACSLPRTVVLIGEKNIVTDDTYYLTTLFISKTLASTASISNYLSDFNKQAEEIFIKNNYNLTSQQFAKYKIQMYVASEPRGLVTKDELRFRKGTYPSHFPDANPRARSLEADFLVIKIKRITDGQITFQAKCQLIEGQELLPGNNFGEITATHLSECLNDLVL